MQLSGAQIIAQSLVKAGVPYAAGIPGHGAWCLTDAFLARIDRAEQDAPPLSLGATRGGTP